jgi:hypothetical protein
MGCCQHSHKAPKLPLVCNVWRGSTPVSNPPALTVACQLYGSAHASFINTPGAAPAASMCQFLYLPARTDIRPADLTGSPDQVECPAGSKRYYVVLWADDIARGFPNEFRIALVVKEKTPPGAVGPWPFPIP